MSDHILSKVHTEIIQFQLGPKQWKSLKKLSGYVPFEIQIEIMQRLPIISLIRFRSVSKQWKSLIDSSKFIKEHRQYQHRILAQYKLETNSGQECECISIIKNNDNDDVSSITLPLLLSSFKNIRMYNSVNGFLCFQGQKDSFETYFAVFWNPIVGKSVATKIPTGLWSNEYIGFGVCPDNRDPKLVRIKTNFDTRRWEVHVFTLSSRVWKKVLRKPVYEWCNLLRNHVCIKGCIYWKASDYFRFDTNVSVSFDLKGEEFGNVRLPGKLSITHRWDVVEVNESLGVLEYDGDGACCVWIMEFVTKSFTKMFTVKVPDQLLYNGVLHNGVLEFRNIGDYKYRLEG